MKLKEFVQLRKFTHRQLARALEISEPAVASYVNETRYPGLFISLKIYLFSNGDVGWEDLLNEKDQNDFERFLRNNPWIRKKTLDKVSQ